MTIQVPEEGPAGFVRRRIAVAVSLAIAGTAQAQVSPPGGEEPKTLSKISVAAPEPEEGAKVDRVASPKFTQPLLDTPQTEYWVVDAMIGYRVTDKMSLQLNGYNLADEEYIATLNNSGARYVPGTPRAALLTVNFEF